MKGAASLSLVAAIAGQSSNAPRDRLPPTSPHAVPDVCSATEVGKVDSAPSKPSTRIEASGKIQTVLKTIVSWDSSANEVLFVGPPAEAESTGGGSSSNRSGVSHLRAHNSLSASHSDQENPNPLRAVVGTARRGFGFSKQMFTRSEWDTLNELCVRKGISQVDLNRIFNKYLTDEAALVRQMRINLIDIMKPFNHYPKVLRDVAAVYFPGIFLRSGGGLAEPHSKEEVSFARFVVTAFKFCAEPIEDLVFDLISLLRNITILEPSAQMSAHSLRELVRVLCADFPDTIVNDIVCNRCACVESNSHLDIMHAMRLSRKYPLMFFQLVRFQRLVQRLIFGHSFWASRGPEVSRFEAEFAKYFQARNKRESVTGLLNSQLCPYNDACDGPVSSDGGLAEIDQHPGISADLNTRPWLNLREATIRTARSIVSDISACKGNVSELFPYFSSEIDQSTDEVSLKLAILLKNVMGPRAARELLEAAELSVASETTASSEPMAEQTWGSDEGKELPAIPEDARTLRFRDEASGSDFVYLPASGERAWVRRIMQGGRLLRERLEFRPAPIK